MLGRLFAQLFKPKPPADVQGELLATALARHRAGDHAHAEAACRAYLERAPDHADALHVLGIVLLAQKKNDEAITTLTRVTQLQASSLEAHFNLANALKAGGEHERALAAYRTAVEVAPGRAEAHVGLAGALSELGSFREAELSLRTALELQPDFAEAHYNLAVLLTRLQRFRDAAASYRATLRIDPRSLLAHSNLLFLLNGHSTDPGEILREHRQWGRVHAAPLAGAPLHANSREPERRLRVAYLSPDFWEHPVARFIEPVLAHHDRGNFEVCCYYAHDHRDGVTARLRAKADRWIDCADLDDAALAERIQADGIDLLVDLAGHTQRNRLLAAARRPAPVIATYLGYPTTSGIESIGYRITDGHVDPPSEANMNVETPVRLPNSYYCYSEIESRVPGPLPARRNGYVTFGSFNTCTKWSEESLALWASVLAAVPESRLLLKARDLAKPQIVERVHERFAALGLDTGRLILKGWEPTRASHFAVYDSVDIAVDTYPYTGATTTCEALCGGVPVVTLEGPTHASRMGASILRAAGLAEWIADSPSRYAAKCAALAADLDALESTRRGLRERVFSSAVMDGARFTADLEREYREMWRAWCAST
jgi:protein O-GlcNAc transferase